MMSNYPKPSPDDPAPLRGKDPSSGDPPKADPAFAVPPEYGDWAAEYISLLAMVDKGTLVMINTDDPSTPSDPTLTDPWEQKVDLTEVANHTDGIIGFDANPNDNTKRGFYHLQGDSNGDIQQITSGLSGEYLKVDGSNKMKGVLSMDGNNIENTDEMDANVIEVSDSLQVPDSFS